MLGSKYFSITHFMAFIHCFLTANNPVLILCLLIWIYFKKTTESKTKRLVLVHNKLKSTHTALIIYLFHEISENLSCTWTSNIFFMVPTSMFYSHLPWSLKRVGNIWESEERQKGLPRTGSLSQSWTCTKARGWELSLGSESSSVSPRRVLVGTWSQGSNPGASVWDVSSLSTRLTTFSLPAPFGSIFVHTWGALPPCAFTLHAGRELSQMWPLYLQPHHLLLRLCSCGKCHSRMSS